MMNYIAVYDDEEAFLGYVDARGELTPDIKHAAQFSSQDTCDEYRWQLEDQHSSWYTERK